MVAPAFAAAWIVLMHVLLGWAVGDKHRPARTLRRAKVGAGLCGCAVIVGGADHSRMRMGPTDAECVRACISAHGASYVLYDGKDIYTLSDQRTPERFAGQKVAVVGALDANTKTIKVESITAAN
jgi:hypothetical protein